MNIAITGATGLLGTALTRALTAGGVEVSRIARGKAAEGDIAWDPETWVIDSPRLEGFDAVVHLAGENLAARRWTAAQKARIRDSRLRGTGLLSESLARL